MTNRGAASIPGFFYDEQRRRYFAVPTSSNVAEFNTRAIHQLDGKIKRQKRQEQSGDSNSLELDKKDLSTQYFLELEVWLERSQKTGIIHRNLKSILDKRSNLINFGRNFQKLQLVHTTVLPIRETGHISGLRLIFQLINHTYVFFGLVFYGTDIASPNISFMINDPEFLKKFSKNFTFDDKFSIVPDYDLFTTLDSRSLYHGPNGQLVINDSSSSRPRSDIKYLLSHNTSCTGTARLQKLRVGTRKVMKIESEVTCMQELDGVIAYGCRNGHVRIMWEHGAAVDIQTSLPVCGLALMMVDGQLFCIISNVNSRLSNFRIDEFGRKADLYLSYSNYHWEWRLSNNMKNDPTEKGIFCVESEIINSQKLELLFYSVFCPKPLKMLAGSFLIDNTDKSDTKWFLFNGSLVVFVPENRFLRIYKAPTSDNNGRDR